MKKSSNDDPRARILELKKQVAVWETQINNTSTWIGEAATEQNNLILQIISSESLLHSSQWELKFNRSYEVRLEAVVNSLAKDPASINMNKIATLMYDWHARFDIEDGISLEFEDNNSDMLMESQKSSSDDKILANTPPVQDTGKDHSFTIRFAESRLVMPFVTKNKMVIDASSLSDKLREIRRNAHQLENISHQLGLKT